MTEDDTFRRLCRPTVEEMLSLYLDRIKICDSKPAMDTVDDWAARYGWTISELNMEAIRRNGF